MALPASGDLDRFAGLHSQTVDRLVRVLAQRIPATCEFNRQLEEETDRQNKAGSESLAQALDAIGVLCAGAQSHSLVEQCAQLDSVESALRRRMAESWERLVELRMGEVAELWERYERDARPLQAREELTGCPSKHEIDRLRHKCEAHFGMARGARDETTWERWEARTASFAVVAETATRLLEGLGQTVSAANRHRRDSARDRRTRRLSIFAIAVSLVVGVGGVLGGWALRDGAGRPPDNSRQAPPVWPRLVPLDRMGRGVGSGHEAGAERTGALKILGPPSFGDPGA